MPRLKTSCPDTLQLPLDGHEFFNGKKISEISLEHRKMAQSYKSFKYKYLQLIQQKKTSHEKSVEFAKAEFYLP